MDAGETRLEQIGESYDIGECRELLIEIEKILEARSQEILGAVNHLKDLGIWYKYEIKENVNKTNADQVRRADNIYKSGLKSIKSSLLGLALITLSAHPAHAQYGPQPVFYPPQPIGFPQPVPIIPQPIYVNPPPLQPGPNIPPPVIYPWPTANPGATQPRLY